MAPRKDKDPSLARLAKRVKAAPFPPTAPADAAVTAKLAAVARRLLLGKRGGAR